MSSVTVEFPIAIQSLSALRSAAYRLIGKANCDFAQAGDVWACTIKPSASSTKELNLAALEQSFRDFVTDENLREQIAVRTDGVRNVILSLAFGALADKSKNVE